VTRRSIRIGVLIVCAYVGIAAVTIALHADHARPLYDSFVPPDSYRFVDPPAFFAAGNVKPADRVAHIALDANGSAPAGIATPDGQFVIDLGRGAIAPAPGATSVEVKITPITPQHVAALPDGLRADGNAYRVDMTYQPTGAPVTTFARPGTMLMEIPELGTQLYAMPTAAAGWAPLASRTLPPRQLTVAAQFTQPGTSLVGTRLPELAAPARARSHTGLVVGVVTAVVALVLFGVAFVIARRRMSARAHSEDGAGHGEAV
jgi:hypothetical protein